MTPENIMNTLKENMEFVLSNYESMTLSDLTSRHMCIQDGMNQLSECSSVSDYIYDCIEICDFLKNKLEKLNEQHED